jgi:hypothetical protein
MYENSPTTIPHQPHLPHAIYFVVKSLLDRQIAKKEHVAIISNIHHYHVGY